MTDGPATRQAVLVVEAPMNSAIQSAVGRFRGRLRKAGIRPIRDGKALGRGCKRDVVRAKEIGQHRAGRTAQRTVRGYVAGVVWRRNERRPTRVRYRVWIAVGSSLTDRRHRSPVIVVVLVVPG